MDVIATAAQMGRLDFVSLGLALLGIALALAAFASYQVVRSAAMEAAREEARERIQEMLPGLVTSALIADAIQERQNLQIAIANLVREHVNNLAMEPLDITGDEADEIADMPDDENSNGRQGERTDRWQTLRSWLKKTLGRQ